MEAKLRYRAQLNSSGVAGKLGGNKKAVPKKIHQSPKKETEKKQIIEEKEPEAPKPKPKPKEKPRIDFIQRNIDEAAEVKSRAHVPKPQPRKYGDNHQPGEIPHYLGSRKEDIETASITHPPAAQCPKGTRLMTDEEKADALSSLREEKAEIEATLGHMPLRIESQSMIRNKRIMETRLDEINHSIDQLSKKYVFIPE